MTKDKTVTMSRELIEVVEAYMSSQADAFPLISLPRGLRSDGLDQVSRELRNALAAPVVERQEPVGEVADMKYNRVQFYRATGDTSKPYLLPGTKLYTSPPELAELQAIISRLTADVETMRAKNNELNDTVERLKGGQGEAVAWFTEDHLTDKSATTYDVGVSVMWAVKGWPVTPLYASQPAPVAVSMDCVLEKMSERFPYTDFPVSIELVADWMSKNFKSIQAAPVSVVLPTREVMRDLIAEVIGGDTYDCTRAWSAWGVGTMSDDDFVPLAEQEERLYELADACLDKVKELNQ